MAKRTQEQVEVKVEEQVEQGSNPEKTAEELEREEEAIKDQEALDLALKLKEEKESKPEIASSHPDQCSAPFGSFNLASDFCKDCAKDFTECANACKAYGDSLKGAKTGAPKSKTRDKSANPVVEGRVRGKYRLNQKLLSEVARPGSKGNDCAKWIFEAGDAGRLATEYTTPGIGLKGYVAYFNKEGFNVVIENGRVYDRTDYSA